MKLRMSPELKDQVEAAAKESGRSMNAEIVHRLQNSFVYEQMEAEEQVDTELFVFYQTAFNAFKRTSEDFDGELRERMNKYLSSISHLMADPDKTMETAEKLVDKHG